MGHKGAYKLPMRKASQVQTSKGMSWILAPSSLDRGGADSDGYSTVSKQLVIDVTEGEGGMKSASLPHIWTCQFLSPQIQMQM